MAVFELIEGWYKLHRRHSALDTILRSITKGFIKLTLSPQAEHRPPNSG
jgi:hypothetical protein